MKRTVAIAFALALALALSATHAARADDATEKSRAAFMAGARALDEGRAQEALTLFQEAYRLHRSYATWYNIGLCERALGHPIEAAEAFRAFLKGGGAQIPSEHAAKVKGLIAESEAKISTLAIRGAPEGASVELDGKAIDASEDASVDPGSHVLVATAPGRDPTSVRVVVEPGKRSLVELDLPVRAAPTSTSPRPPESGPRLDGVFWGFAIASAGCFVAGGVMGGVALGDLHTYKDPSVSDGDAANAKSQGDVLKVTADVAFLAGIATGAAAVFFAATRKREPPRSALFFGASPSRAFVGLRGAF